MPIPDRVCFINKRFTNRLTAGLAGKRFSPIALVLHTGRKSGRLYRTPVLTEERADRFVFALTYGDHVDWYQNVMTAGGCDLLWRGKKFHLQYPQQIPPQEGLREFPSPQREVLKWLHIADFFVLTKVTQN